MTATTQARCGHEGATAGSCPQDRLCQIRLGGERWGTWETVAVVACDGNWQAWQRQVAPRKRRQGYETRVIRLGRYEASPGYIG